MVVGWVEKGSGRGGGPAKEQTAQHEESRRVWPVGRGVVISSVQGCRHDDWGLNSWKSPLLPWGVDAEPQPQWVQERVHPRAGVKTLAPWHACKAWAGGGRREGRDSPILPLVTRGPRLSEPDERQWSHRQPLHTLLSCKEPSEESKGRPGSWR